MAKRKICVSTYLESEFGRQVLAGVGEATASHGWDLTCIRLSDLKPHVLSAFDGVICNIHNAQLATEIVRLGRPTVNLLHLDESLEVAPCVRTDHREIGRLAAEHLHERHFANFAYCGYPGILFSDFRRDAFLAALATFGRTAHVYARKSVQIAHEIMTDRLVRSASDDTHLATWLRTLPKPIGVFCCNDERASGLAEVCRKIGLAVPAQVAILGVDNDLVIDYLSHSQLTSVDPDAQCVGRTAVRMLAAQFDSRQVRTTRHVELVPPKRHVSRGSTEVFPVQPEWLAQALVFIHRNATQGISAADVVRHVGYSHTFVQRAFREKLGSTIQREIARTRLLEADRLISLGELKVSEIAKLCGYASFQYFCNCYTSVFGHSPSHSRQPQAPLDGTIRKT